MHEAALKNLLRETRIEVLVPRYNTITDISLDSVEILEGAFPWHYYQVAVYTILL